MTARKADPRVERWANSIEIGDKGRMKTARRIVRAIDRARRDATKAERERMENMAREMLRDVGEAAERAILRAGKERAK